MGWYHSTPKDAKESRGEQFKRTNKGLELNLPKCRDELLVLLFYEAGICSSGMNGLTPLTWGDINNWVQATERELLPYYKELVLDMSRAYVKEYHAGQEETSIEPILDSIMDEDEKKEAIRESSFCSFFDNLGVEE